MTIQPIDPIVLREQFPALRRTINGQPAVFLDGPGGTQAPERVIEAMTGYLRSGSSNHGGPFQTSRETDAATDSAREAMRDMLNANRAEEIVFGQNMTSLTFSISRAIAQEWQPGDEIVLTRIDHDGNVSPWLRAAEDRGVTVRRLDFRPENCTLAIDTLPGLLNDKTRLVAVNYASNAVGTINDVAKVVEMAHAVGALVYVDAVHYAPHDVVDVQALDCDFLACSVYKFFGPHTGVLYGKYEHLDRLNAYRVRPAGDIPPGKWETGTQSFESLSGVTAAIDYLASLGGQDGTRRERIARGMKAIKQYEATLSERFLQAATRVPGIRVYGITDPEELERRTPTFAISLAGFSPEYVATYLGDRGFFVWHGHYYAVEVMARLGLLESGGLVRIGFTHYNTYEELDRLIEALIELAATAQ
ncbi:MAG TPA: cysteine desulfurase-like protein [Promineifilum sp.]|nr:cysteine desulfurase-like protein [Promineifilum sp.]HRO91243.1 cysteine desulfurase-like protein [Promineifilum sp.]